MIKSNIVFIVVFFLYYSIFATQCLIVSGRDAERDPKGPFHQERFYDTYTLDGEVFSKETVAQKDCRIFGSWFQLDDYVRNKVPKDEKLIIIQGAHGSPNGGAACNLGQINGASILFYLDNLSKTRPVAAFIDSCYSGDLIRGKLMNDSLKNPSTKNLCLVTTSYFSRLAHGDGGLVKALTNARPEDSAEKVFSQTFKGMISSAAWETIGATQYFNESYGGLSTLIGKLFHSKKEPIDPLKCMYNVSTNLNEDLTSGSLKTCAGEGFTDEDMIKVLKLGNAGTQIINLEELKTWRENIKANYDKNELKTRSILKSLDTKINTQHDKFLLEDVYGTIVYNYKQFTDIENEFLYRDFSPPKRLLKLFNEYVELNATITQYLKDLTKKNDEKYNCSTQNKRKMIASILGVMLYQIESENYRELFVTTPDFRLPTPATALNEFIRASLMIKEYENPLDDIRRKACRNFTFE